VTKEKKFYNIDSRFLKEVGVGFFQRQLRQLSSQTVVIDVTKRGILNVETIGPFGTSTEKRVVIGEEETEVLPSGEKVRVLTVRESDDTLITRIRQETGKNIQIRQTFSGDGFQSVITFENSDFAAVRYFKRIP
jgi:hypothetical protein